ncbi:MAG: Rne/Rng family ribonuclease, partial [Solirubrobacterales bacterium]
MRKRIFVSVDPGETRVAVQEAKGTARSDRDGRKKKGDRSGGRKSADAGGQGKDGDWKVAELYVERRGQRSIVGNIYKGVVDNVLPGMEAAFVDIGLERNGFLHVDEIVLP